MSLAFVTACQLLPPRQLAVLVLRDVLGFPAAEVAAMLGISVDAANSALKRARAGLQRSRGAAPSTGRGRRGRRRGGAPAEAEVAAAAARRSRVVARFVRAWEAADVAGLVDLLTDDVFMSMPPMPFEYHGRDAVARFSAALFDGGRRFDLVATRANGQPAFGAYLRAPTGLRHGVGLYVLGLRGDRINALTRFESSVLPASGFRGRSRCVREGAARTTTPAAAPGPRTPPLDVGGGQPDRRGPPSAVARTASATPSLRTSASRTTR